MSNRQNVAVPIRNELGALLEWSGEPLPSVGFYECIVFEGSDAIEMRDYF